MNAQTLAALKVGVLLQSDDLRIIIALSHSEPLTVSKLCELLDLRSTNFETRIPAPHFSGSHLPA
jgi:hypothetical protein